MLASLRVPFFYEWDFLLIDFNFFFGSYGVRVRFFFMIKFLLSNLNLYI